MAKLIPTRFSSYELSEEETLRGSILSIEQKWFLQNSLCIEAIAKNSLESTVNSGDMNEYIRDEAFYRGKIEFIEWLLANSDAAELALHEFNSQQRD